MSLQEKIENLETDLHLMGRLVLDSLVDGVRALEDKDVNRAIATIEKDDEIDDAYLKIDQDWVELMATEQLVATDLRLSTSILQASLHLERLGDLAVYLGNTTQEIFDSPVPETIHATVVEMGDLVIDMASSAMESLKNRDKDLAIATAEKDNQVNRLYNAILEEAPKIAGNEDLFNGLFRLVTCIRTLERGGDHAVDICRSIRKSSDVPIIMVTAKDSEADRVAGLELGADDYVTKPFSVRELMSRVRAVLRRATSQTSTKETVSYTHLTLPTSQYV